MSSLPLSLGLSWFSPLLCPGSLYSGPQRTQCDQSERLPETTDRIMHHTNYIIGLYTRNKLWYIGLRQNLHALFAYVWVGGHGRGGGRGGMIEGEGSRGMIEREGSRGKHKVQFIVSPKASYLQAIEHIFHTIKATKNYIRAWSHHVPNHNAFYRWNRTTVVLLKTCWPEQFPSPWVHSPPLSPSESAQSSLHCRWIPA